MKETKGRDVRVLPITKDMKKHLLRRITEINDSKLYNNYNHQYDSYLSLYSNGDIITDERITKRFAIDMKHLHKKDPSIPIITFHGLRHSCASWLLYKGVDMKIIQEILGHSDLHLTSEIYTHISLEQKLEALNRLQG